MAENPENFEEEYQFSDLDEAGGVFQEPKQSSSDYQAVDGDLNLSSKLAGSDIKKKAAIGVGLLVILLVAYKFMGAFFSDDSVPSAPAPAQMSSPRPSAVPRMPQNLPTMASPVATVTRIQSDPQIKQKLSTLEMNIRNSRNEMGAINNNVEALKNSLHDLTYKISQLNKNISMLSEHVIEQQHQIAQLKKKPKKKVRRIVRKTKPRVNYFIQAIIPGRAWLMSSNGTTITVSEGASVPGYGRVKLIDPHQGRVMMTSGTDIVFSPNDT